MAQLSVGNYPSELNSLETWDITLTLKVTPNITVAFPKTNKTIFPGLGWGGKGIQRPMRLMLHNVSLTLKQTKKIWGVGRVHRPGPLLLWPEILLSNFGKNSLGQKIRVEAITEYFYFSYFLKFQCRRKGGNLTHYSYRESWEKKSKLSVIGVLIAKNHLNLNVDWRDICWNILERDHTNVTNVRKRLRKNRT